MSKPQNTMSYNPQYKKRANVKSKSIQVKKVIYSQFERDHPSLKFSLSNTIRYPVMKFSAKINLWEKNELKTKFSSLNYLFIYFWRIHALLEFLNSGEQGRENKLVGGHCSRCVSRNCKQSNTYVQSLQWLHQLAVQLNKIQLHPAP